MARQKDTFYFDGFRRSADYACQAAKLLSEVMHDFNPGQLRERMDSRTSTSSATCSTT